MMRRRIANLRGYLLHNYSAVSTLRQNQWTYKYNQSYSQPSDRLPKAYCHRKREAIPTQLIAEEEGFVC